MAYEDYLFAPLIDTSPDVTDHKATSGEERFALANLPVRARWLPQGDVAEGKETGFPATSDHVSSVREGEERCLMIGK